MTKGKKYKTEEERKQASKESRRRYYKNKYHPDNIDAIIERREKAKKRRETDRYKQTRKKFLLGQYGISIDDYNNMFEK